MNNKDLLLIGNNIRKWRNLKGVKQLELAVKINISRATLSKIENGKQEVGIQRMTAIASILNIHTTELYNDPEHLVS